MPRISPSHLPFARQVFSRIDRAFRWRANEEIGRHLDGVYGRLDQLTDRIEELERRVAGSPKPPAGDYAGADSATS
jgi:hypothetical protein